MQDLDKDEYVPEPYRPGAPEQVLQLHRTEADERRKRDKVRQGRLSALGFEKEHSGEIIF